MVQENAKICLAKPLRQARLMRRINYLKMDDRRARISLEEESGKRPSEPGFPRSQHSRQIVLNPVLRNPSSGRMTLGRDISLNVLKDFNSLKMRDSLRRSESPVIIIEVFQHFARGNSFRSRQLYCMIKYEKG
jgi:hypothetical protein